MKFAEIPQRLSSLLHPPDPIVINHMISVEELRQTETKKTACYDIDVEVRFTLLRYSVLTINCLRLTTLSRPR